MIKTNWKVESLELLTEDKYEITAGMFERAIKSNEQVNQ